MKIFFNRIPKISPYGGGNQFLSSMVGLLKNNGFDVTFNLDKDIDVIFLMDPRPADPQNISIKEIVNYKLLNPNVKILHRVNECDARKNTNFIDNLLLSSMSFADEVVFISEWLRDYFVQKGFNKNSSVIYNGCDVNLFFPSDKQINVFKPKLVTHHWSDNWMKGFDIYTEIDKFLCKNEDFEFTYIGRYYNGYAPLKTKIVPPLYGSSLAKELRTHDIYVTASRWEPCGMHHIEGAACGLPVLFHKDGGGINEAAARYGRQFEDFSSFLQCVEEVKENIQEYKKKIFEQKLSINSCCEKFKEIILNFNEEKCRLK